MVTNHRGRQFVLFSILELLVEARRPQSGVLSWFHIGSDESVLSRICRLTG